MVVAWPIAVIARAAGPPRDRVSFGPLERDLDGPGADWSACDSGADCALDTRQAHADFLQRADAFEHLSGFSQ